MESSTMPPDEDPLVAALPPATDYITYLTLLEYQLSPQNLSTLNGLLSSDDGTLAEEIGWDLLKLVLPMLADAPQEANNCLEIIARRGNPREVVVRVAEELENLGNLDGDDNDDYDLPTFAGEATRIHLGSMTLDGMPETQSQTKPFEPATGTSENDLAEREPDEATGDEAIKLQALLGMLSILHPRIKTQYPSRFLATSLPASLGAYRRVPLTRPSTEAFLTVLAKLSGKRKPVLPPRTPSSLSISNVSRPDPEAGAEEPAGAGTTPEIEKAIISRLLQAVFLEVLDEYMSALQTLDLPCMSWTTRLRERVEPGRVVPGSTTELQLWAETPELKERDDLLSKFLSLGKELQLRAGPEIATLLTKNGHDGTVTASKDSQDVEDASEYPTSPGQIPFPPTGLALFYAAEAYYAGFQDVAIQISDIANLVTMLVPFSDTPSLPAPAVQDALLSLLYQKSHSPSMYPDPERFTELLSSLTQTFTITPYAPLRDSAHHIATKLLHTQPDAKVRLSIIMQTLRCFAVKSGPSSEPIPLSPPFNEGVLKAVGVDWLKDEFLAFLKHQSGIDQTTQRAAEEAARSNPEGLNPTLLSTDTSLQTLLFPSIELSSSSNTSDDSLTTPKLLLSLPFYISTLNLLCVLLASSSASHVIDSAQASTHLASLEQWRDHLIAQLDKADAPEEIKSSIPDVYALDDACRRARALLVLGPSSSSNTSSTTAAAAAVAVNPSASTKSE